MDLVHGRTTAVGVKANIRHFKADLHQREQTKVIRHERLQKVGTLRHKPFYAAEVMLDDVQLRALQTVFEDHSRPFLQKASAPFAETPPIDGTVAKDLTSDDAPWYNFDDYVDTDVRPTDHNPHLLMWEVGACPHFHYSRWLPALKMKPGVIEKMKEGHWYGANVEASKFGHEKTHLCLIGEHKGKNASVDTQSCMEVAD